MSEAVRLQLLGPFGLSHSSRPIRSLPKKAQALLAYLAMQRGKAVPREQLAELLWGRSGGEQARRSLRQCLMSIRTGLKSARDMLIADVDAVSLAPDMEIDIARFERLCASSHPDDLETASELYRDEFLAGLQINSGPFAEWALVERRRLSAAMSELLHKLASARAQTGELDKAIATAERLTTFDGLREDGHRLLMQLLARAGRRDAALKQYAICTEILRRDLGVKPEPATAALAEAIRNGDAGGEAATVAGARAPARGPHDRNAVAGTAAPALALPDKPSIALLPFSNLSSDPDQTYFAGGMAEDLAIALGRIPWLFVIASSSTASYRDRAIDVRRVGAELGVRYVLRGSVRRSDRRLRIVVQLADASDERHIWSDRFEGHLDDVFAMQEQVATQVASFIAPALQSVEIARAQHKPTDSLTAYELYLRAVPRFRTSLAENREAIRALRKAIEIDPGYAAAYGFAARCYQFQKLLGWVPPTDPQLEEGVRFGQLAADIGQNDSEALWMAGHALAQLSGESERGLALIDRSLVLNPSSANAWLSSCNVRAYLGDAETAIEHFERAYRLNPLDSMHHVRWNILGLAYLSAGDFEAAERAADKALNVAPKYAPALRLKVIACGLLGQVEEAREHVKRLLAVHPAESISWLNTFWGPLMRRNPRMLANMIDGARRAGLPEGEC